MCSGSEKTRGNSGFVCVLRSLGSLPIEALATFGTFQTVEWLSETRENAQRPVRHRHFGSFPQKISVRSWIVLLLVLPSKRSPLWGGKGRKFWRYVCLEPQVYSFFQPPYPLEAHNVAKVDGPIQGTWGSIGGLLPSHPAPFSPGRSEALDTAGSEAVGRLGRPREDLGELEGGGASDRARPSGRASTFP